MTVVSPARVTVLALVCALALGHVPATLAAAEPPTRVAVAPLQTSSFPEIQTTVVAFNNVGLPIQGLTSENFELFEDGKTVPVTSVQQVSSATDAVVTVILGLDVSGSMEGKPLTDAVGAISAFVDRLSPGDQAAALSFGAVNGKCFFDTGYGLTTDKNAVKTHLQSAVAGGDTPLYDATLAAIQMASNAPSGQRLVVMVTDGEDTCSKVTPDTTVAAAVRNGVPLYFIGLGPDLNGDELRSLASLTGGQYFAADDSSKLDALYQGITDRLRTHYTVRHRSAQIADRKEHVLGVRVRTSAGDATTEARFTPPVREVRPQLSLNPGQTVDGPTRVEVTSNDPLVRLSRAEFFLDGASLQTVSEAPFAYMFDPSTLRPGTYTFSVRATDVGGGVGEQTLQVEVPRAGLEVWGVWVAVLAGVLLLPTLAIVALFVINGRRKLRCQRCHRPLQASWSACPYCSRPETAAPVVGVATEPGAIDLTPRHDSLRPGGRAAGSQETNVVVADAPTVEPISGNGTHATRVLNAPARSVGWLVVSTGDHRGQRHRLGDDETTIGRGEENNIVLDDQSASRQHAKIRQSNGEYYVTDLDTTNGTLVNGRRIARHKLQQGDQLTIGGTTLAFMPLPDQTHQVR